MLRALPVKFSGFASPQSYTFPSLVEKLLTA